MTEDRARPDIYLARAEGKSVNQSRDARRSAGRKLRVCTPHRAAARKSAPWSSASAPATAGPPRPPPAAPRRHRSPTPATTTSVVLVTASPSQTPDAPLESPKPLTLPAPLLRAAGPFPPPIDWEVARREEIIQMEVNRRLVEEEVRREFQAKGDPAFSRGHHGGPFFAPDHFVPMPMHPAPHAPPPMPFEGFGAWQGFNQFGPRPHAGFGENMPFLCRERRWSPPPRPKPKHKLKLLEIEPSGRPEVCAHASSSLDCSDKYDVVIRTMSEVSFFQIRHKKCYLAHKLFLHIICSFLA